MEWFVLILATALIVLNKQFAYCMIWWNKFTIKTDFEVSSWVYRLMAILFGIFFFVVAIDKLTE